MRAKRVIACAVLAPASRAAVSTVAPPTLPEIGSENAKFHRGSTSVLQYSKACGYPFGGFQ